MFKQVVVFYGYLKQDDLENESSCHSEIIVNNLFKFC